VGKNQLGRIRFIDTLKLEPRTESIKGKNNFGNLHVVGTVYIITKENFVNDLHHEIAEKIRILEAKGKLTGGVSILPARQGILARILGYSSEDVKKIIFEVIRIARKQIIGASFSGIRKA